MGSIWSEKKSLNLTIRFSKQQGKSVWKTPNQRRNISKGVKKNQAISTLSHGKASNRGLPGENKFISFPTKIRLHKSLFVSILLYGCERWTLTADLEIRKYAFENKCYRRALLSMTDSEFGARYKCSDLVAWHIIQRA